MIDRRDSHFGCIHHFLKAETLVKKLSCSQDIVDAINKYQHLSNIERIKKNKDPIQTIPLIHDYSNDKIVKLKVIKDLKCYYNLYTNNELKLYSTVYTDLNNQKSFPVNSKETMSNAPFSKAFLQEKIIEPVTENLDKLWRKNNKVENLLSGNLSDSTKM